MKCDNAGCRCQETKVQSAGHNYCSQACANAARSGSAPSGGCGCGHPNCG